MNLLFKWFTIPSSNETKQVEAVQLWEVRWQSRYGENSWCVQPEMECFTSEELAKEFVASLESAFKLVRHTSGTKVTIRRAA